MKKLFVVAAVLAVVLSASGIFAVDVKTWSSMTAEEKVKTFDSEFRESKAHQNYYYYAKGNDAMGEILGKPEVKPDLTRIKKIKKVAIVAFNLNIGINPGEDDYKDKVVDVNGIDVLTNAMYDELDAMLKKIGFKVSTAAEVKATKGFAALKGYEIQTKPYDAGGAYWGSDMNAYGLKDPSLDKVFNGAGLFTDDNGDLGKGVAYEPINAMTEIGKELGVDAIIVATVRGKSDQDDNGISLDALNWSADNNRGGTGIEIDFIDVNTDDLSEKYMFSVSCKNALETGSFASNKSADYDSGTNTFYLKKEVDKINGAYLAALSVIQAKFASLLK